MPQCLMEDTTSGDVGTDPPEPPHPAQEIHSSKCITGLEDHKAGKAHCCFLQPYITQSIVTSTCLAPVSPGFHGNLLLLLLCPQPHPQLLQTLHLQASSSCLAPRKGLREQLPGSPSTPQGLCQFHGMQVGAQGCCG